MQPQAPIGQVSLHSLQQLTKLNLGAVQVDSNILTARVGPV